ncbi:MAG: hypothetical protein HZA81_02905 [Candidatus Taylorbacteria bacterium]|nr:hypothetical protein [Candidatus Taylorbacteria bacterium]
MTKSRPRKVLGSFLVFLGFWLSPLSPWNDVFTNVPIAYAFGFVFSFFYPPLFFPLVVIGYWLTNALGFVLMHYGYAHLHSRHGAYSFRKHWKTYALATTLYTLLIVVLIWYGILPSAQEVVGFFR